MAKGSWLNEEEYEWDASKWTADMGIPFDGLLTAPARWRKMPRPPLLFSEWRVAFLIDDPPRKQIYTRLIERGGGKVVRTVSASKEKPLFDGMITHAFYDHESATGALKDQGILCHPCVYIGECILKVSAGS